MHFLFASSKQEDPHFAFSCKIYTKYTKEAESVQTLKKTVHYPDPNFIIQNTQPKKIEASVMLIHCLGIWRLNEHFFELD